MATTLEERVAALEAKVAELSERNGEKLKPMEETPWWEAIFGTFKDDPEYDEAMRLGAEYRNSLRPKDDESGAGQN